MIIDLNRRYIAPPGFVRAGATGVPASAQNLYPTAGGEILISGGLTAALVISGHVLGAGNGAWRGGAIVITGGSGTAILSSGATSRFLTLFIAGVDRTAYLGIGMKRVWQIGSSGSNCQFPLLGRDLPDYRPEANDEVLIFRGATRFFCGFVDNYTDTVQRVNPGTGLFCVTLMVTAVTYGAMLDREFIGRKYIRPYAFLANIVLYDLISENFGAFGITWGGSSGDGGNNIGEPLFNWDTGAQAIQQICDMNAWQYLVNMSKSVVAFPAGTGHAPAPWTLDDAGDKWLSIVARRNFTPYANSILVRNSTDLVPLWSDTFTSDGSTPSFLPSSDLSAAPVVIVDGVRKKVIDFGDWSQPWDAYWLQYSVIFATPPPAGAIVQIIYPSPLSFVWKAEDAADIAARGRFQFLQEVQNVTDPAIGQQIADGLLAIMKAAATDLEIVTDWEGLEPGQLLPVNTAKPPLNDDWLIEEVDSDEIDGTFFRHTVKATNAQLVRSKSPVAFVQKLIAAARQPKRDTPSPLGITLAETIPGEVNNGLVAGLQNTVLQAPRAGFARDVTLIFPEGKRPLTNDVVVDVLVDGVSVFPAGDTNKMVYPVGAAALQTQFIFTANPLAVRQWGIVTFNVLVGDAAAKDGSIVFTVL